MSHFTVAVVTKEEPNSFNKLLEDALQPYHEYECTGTLDKYVVWVDQTEEHKEEYIEGSRRMYVNSLGKFICPYSDDCYREPNQEEQELINRGIHGAGNLDFTSRDWKDGRGYRPKFSFIPEGFVEKEMPYTEIYKTLEIYLKDWGGLTDDNFKYGQTGKMTNPNAKWDGWMIGGRYSGAFKAKNHNEALQGEKSWTNEKLDIEDFDVIQKKNIDVDAMISVALEKVDKEWAMFEDATKNGIPKSWGQGLKDKKDELNISDDDFLPRDAIDELRKEHHSQKNSSVLKDLSSKLGMMLGCPIDHFCSGDKEAFISKMKYYELGTFAFLMDGNWIEQGKMGWWACVSDEDKSWETKWFEIFDTIDDEHWITVVDCHI
jgi:hypothetical protein